MRPVAAQSELTQLIVHNMRTLRKRRHISCTEIEKLTGISRAIITNIENSRREVITVDELFAFAMALSVPVEMLYTELPPACAVCSDVPPAGFMCGTCGIETPLPSIITHDA